MEMQLLHLLFCWTPFTFQICWLFDNSICTIVVVVTSFELARFRSQFSYSVVVLFLSNLHVSHTGPPLLAAATACIQPRALQLIRSGSKRPRSIDRPIVCVCARMRARTCVSALRIRWWTCACMCTCACGCASACLCVCVCAPQPSNQDERNRRQHPQ